MYIAATLRLSVCSGGGTRFFTNDVDQLRDVIGRGSDDDDDDDDDDGDDGDGEGGDISWKRKTQSDREETAFVVAGVVVIDQQTDRHLL